MEANTTTASPVIPASAPVSQRRPTEGIQSRGDQGDSSAAFSQRTNVSIETAIDHMTDVLSKISGRQQTNVQQMPQELKEVIQNMIRQSFSLETTLGQGLGSTAASQRFSTDQLTTLSRMLNQLGTMAEAGSIPQVSDDLATLLTGLKMTIAKETGGAFEPIMLTKAAFQLLDTGNAELLPKDLQTFLTQLNAQGSGQAALSGNMSTTSLSFLNQLVQLLMPRGTENTAQQMPPTPALQEVSVQPAVQNLSGRQETSPSSAVPNTTSAMPGKTVPQLQTSRAQTPTDTATLKQAGSTPQESTGKLPQASAQPNISTTQSTQTTTNEGVNTQKSAYAEIPQGTTPAERTQTPVPSTANTQSSAQDAKESAISLVRQGEQKTHEENRPVPDAGTRTPNNIEPQAQATKSNSQEESSVQYTRPPGRQEAELPATNASAQSTAQMKSPEMQSTIPRFFTQMMENTPQTMNVLRNLAQTLLQSENLSPKETLLLQNFVSGRSQTLSEGDANQLQQLIRLTQQNIPGTVRQAAFEQQVPDLPRVWAFMQMADIVKTRKMTAEQYKRAGRDVAALALTMRSALEGENAAPQPGQRSMNFVMPLFMGTSEYPSYIHVYDESHKDEETGAVKKETWLRICVLTDNIGTVELINRIYEKNHVDMRLYFSDADAAWEFRNALDTIRETADGTSLIIEGIQIGAIGERRFFTN